jgi:endonuclease YncB( thermonuclease family)
MSHLFAHRITTSFTLLLALSSISVSKQVKAAPPDSVRAQPLSGTIVSVGDGDTICVRTADKTLTVRLGCIDLSLPIIFYKQQQQRLLKSLNLLVV